MPPRPECEFDCNLPHGSDNYEETTPVHDPNDLQSDDASTDGARMTTSDLNSLFQDDQCNAQQTMNSVSLGPGFSDDEDCAATFDRSWSTNQARKPLPKLKKSPRRSDDDDGDDESSPRNKRPRKSLFGGPVGEFEDNDDADDLDEDFDMPNTSDAPRPDLRQRMSSLNLDEDKDNSQDNATYNIGFALEPPERDSLSPPPSIASRASSENSAVIPAEERVSYFLLLQLFEHIVLTLTAHLRVAPKHRSH